MIILATSAAFGSLVLRTASPAQVDGDYLQTAITKCELPLGSYLNH
jgi:hypothetical protein